MAKKWMQKVVKNMKKGSFKAYCGGKVTLECIKRAKNSSDPTIRKRAALALTMMKASGAISKKAKAEHGGEIKYGFDALNHLLSSSSMDYIFDNPEKYKSDFKSIGRMMAALGLDVSTLTNSDNEGPLTSRGKDIKEAIMSKNLKAAMDLIEPFVKKFESVDLDSIVENMNDKEKAKELLSTFKDNLYLLKESLNSGDIIKAAKQANDMIISLEKLDNLFDLNGIDSSKLFENRSLYKFEYGGSTNKKYSYDDGGSVDSNDMSEVNPQTNNVNNASTPVSEGYDITYEQFVDFVSRYPEYFKRLLSDLQQQSSQQQMSENANVPVSEQPQT